MILRSWLQSFRVIMQAATKKNSYRPKGRGPNIPKLLRPPSTRAHSIRNNNQILLVIKLNERKFLRIATPPPWSIFFCNNTNADTPRPYGGTINGAKCPVKISYRKIVWYGCRRTCRTNTPCPQEVCQQFAVTLKVGHKFLTNLAGSCSNQR